MGVDTQGGRRGSFQAGSDAKVTKHHPPIVVDEHVCRLHSRITPSAQASLLILHCTDEPSPLQQSMWNFEM